MGYCVYILRSEKLSRFYVGYTSDIGTRLLFHRHPESRKFTANAKDWILFLKIDCRSQGQAMEIEAHIKKMKSSVYIQNLKRYPEMVLKLLENYD